MNQTTPYYERTLDSFADDVITRQRQRADGNWHAVLDTGLAPQVSDPDFSPYGYGATREQAAARSAKAIRDDAVGIGKFAPHSVLEDGYDLKFRLMKHWTKKERLIAVGMDPNAVMNDASSLEVDRWKLKGSYLEWAQDTRQLEFDFQLLLAESCLSITEHGVDPAEARDALVTAVEAVYRDRFLRTSPGEGTWSLMEARIDERFDALELSAPRP